MMEKINTALNKLANTGQFKKRYDHLKDEVLSDPDIVLYLNENSSTVTNEMVEKSLVKLYEFTTQSKHNCEKCPTLGECKNVLKGYQPRLIIQGNSLDLQYDMCPRKAVDDDKKKREKLIQSLYVPRDILSASIRDFYQTDSSAGRMDAAEKATIFATEYEAGKKQKGLYLHGQFGVGKTYLLGAIANELAERKIPSMIVYVPDFLRELKGSIGDNTLNSKIEMVKKASVLMLDDLGAESMTSWGRDEVIGPILQFRMLENLPTFFTSNFNFAELKNHLTFSQRGEKEEVKAARVMERIMYLADPIHLDGKNRRH
ncbi:primosomal protein DnaI [Peribacillus psychrosaccharolyticus]|nr:primosomal protein DnaI [Peribacillus psychrosaccharolyticus]